MIQVQSIQHGRHFGHGIGQMLERQHIFNKVAAG